MNSKHIKFAILGVVAAGFFLLLFGTLQNSEATIGNGMTSESGNLPTANLAGAQETVDPIIPVQRVSGAKTGASIAFGKANSCMKYSRLRTFFDNASKDPASALNDPTTAASLTEEQRIALKENMKFVEEHDAQCNAAIMEKGAGIVDLYRLAEDAARGGDMNAAACFILAEWPVVDATDQDRQRFALTYARTSKEFLGNGVRMGDWKVVNAAVAAARVEHGTVGAVGFADEERYYLYRLSQLGAPNASWEGAMGYEAASLARSLKGPVRDRAESRAVDDFGRYFKKERMKEDDLNSCEV